MSGSTVGSGVDCSATSAFAVTSFRWRDLLELAGDHSNGSVVALVSQSRTPPSAPRFTFGPVPAELSRFFYDESIVYSVNVVTLKQAGVAGDGFVSQDGAFLTAPAYGLSPDYIEKRLNGRAPTTIRKEAGRAIVLTGPGYLIYGHWLVDILPKLYLLSLLDIDLSQETLVIPADTPPFGLEWLALLGVNPKRTITYHPSDEMLVFDEVILPLQLRANSRVSALFAPAARALLDRIGAPAKQPSPVPTDRIYLSRQRSGRTGRQLANAAALEDVARRYDYAIVHPELMSLPQQVAMFRSCRFLVGEYGSALHGSIFAGADCIVCPLRGTLTEPGFLQSGLCQAFGQQCGYVFGETHLNEDGTQLTEVDPKDLQSALHMMNLLAAG